MDVSYRRPDKKDYEAIKGIINESFGLRQYVTNPAVLESFLNVYLYSCLSESGYINVAERNGKVVGIIMGNSKHDYRLSENIKSISAMGYHKCVLFVKSVLYKNNSDSFKRIQKIYGELHKNHAQNFDGSLTLFAVSEAYRGLGIGKQLLQNLMVYQLRHQTQNLYLYTDSACNIGFYEKHGFSRLGEQGTLIRQGDTNKKMDIYIYGYCMNGYERKRSYAI